jgi:predicted nucleic acid-binding protein
MTDEELKLSITLPSSLHVGERACLAITRQRGWGLLTDDRSARQQARAWVIPLSGKLDVLLLAVREGIEMSK